MEPQVSIIILNYNTPELTTACVQSIIAHTAEVSYEIVLVDNGSAQESKTYFDRYLKDIPNLTIYYTHHNHGFGGGNNIGYKASSGEYLFFLNSDTIFFENTLHTLYHLYHTLGKEMRIGLLGPRLYLTPEKTLVQPGGTELPTVGKVFIASFPGCKKIFTRTYKKFIYADWDRNSDRQIGTITGAAMYCARKVFEDIGQFDEKFFLYMEEFDLTMRLESHGYKNYYTTETSIVHLENQTPKVTWKKMLISLSSLIRFMRKYIRYG